jgi:hypothetical protein
LADQCGDVGELYPADTGRLEVVFWRPATPGDQDEVAGMIRARADWMREHGLATTVTHPDCAGQRLGCLIAWWTLDHAARAGYQHVRRGCGYPELVRSYRDIQGWRLAHTVDRRGVTAYLLTRPAELQPGIAGRITELRTMSGLPIT